MSEEPIDDIELEEAEPVDGSSLDVSLVEEVNSNSKKNYCCDVCNKVFRRKAHLVRHIKTHDAKAKEARCSDCNIFFKDVEALQNHITAKHQNIICDVCGKLFKRRDLETHSKTHHPVQGASDTSCSLICPFEGCRKVFFRKTKYHDHINRHIKQTPYECEICKNKFASKYGRNAHQRVCSGSKRIECNMCGKVFQHEGSLHNHRLAVHSITLFKCGCGASYKYRSGLLRHRGSKNH